MRVVGIGIDVEKSTATEISISRYGDSWLRRQFTNFEIDRAPGTEQAVYFASLFAVKEAVSKALGNGIDDELTLLSIQVTLERHQIKSIVFLPPAVALVRRLGVEQVHAGVAIFGDHVIATAIAEG